MHTEQTGKPKIGFIYLVILAFVSLASLNGCHSPEIFQQRFLQFGTIIDITLVTTDEDRAYQVFDEIELLLKKRHFEWHGWENGTLKRFNQALLKQHNTPTHTESPLNGIEIPNTLQKLILDSKKYYSLSDGLFNPAMGKLIQAWGFHQESEPDQVLINSIKKDMPGMHDLIINNNQARSLNPYLQLDFGAIAKGLAVKQIVDLINQHRLKNFIINAGGDIYAQGRKTRQNWHIAIENPFSEGIIGRLKITSSTSIFTSGNYRRFYLDKNDIKRHHIINPLSGEPSTNISSITLLHDDPIAADVAATTLMLTQLADLKTMAGKLNIQHYLAITESHELYISPSMVKKIQWQEAQNFKIHLIE